MKHNPQNIHNHIIGPDLQQQQHEGGEHSFQVCQGIVGKLTVLLSRQQELRARLSCHTGLVNARPSLVISRLWEEGESEQKEQEQEE